MINYTIKRLVLSLNILICIFFSAMSSASEEHHAEQPESLADFYSQEFNEEHTDHDDHTHDGEHGHSHETEQHDNHADHNDEHHHEESTTIPPHIAKQVGIATKQAGPAELKHQVTAYGTLTTAPEQLSHVRARFPGVIYSVKANIGDRVTQGDLLAEIESNESLKRYAIRAPISGTIIQRHANAGEMTREQELFSIARFDSLWAELKVFPSQKQKIQAGQTVDIVLDKISTAATISH